MDADMEIGAMDMLSMDMDMTLAAMDMLGVDTDIALTTMDMPRMDADMEIGAMDMLIVEELQKRPQLTPRGSNSSRDMVSALERRVSELEQNRSAHHEKQAQTRQNTGGKTVFPYLDIERKVKGTLGKISDLEIRVGRLEEARSKMGDAGTPQVKGTRRHRVTNKQEIGNTRPGKVGLRGEAKGTPTRVSKIETRMDRREPHETRTGKAERRHGVMHFGQLSRDTVPFRSVSSSSDASDNDGGVRELYLSGSSRTVLCPLLGLDVQEHRNSKAEHNSLLRHKMSLDKPKKMCATTGVPYTDSPQYWEVQAAVKLLDVLKPGHSIFEITLSQQTKEAHRTLDHQDAVRMSLSYCKDHERVCVMTTTGRDVYVKHDTDLIKNIKDVHTWIRFEIGILVDRKKKSAAFLNLRQNAIFAVVKDPRRYSASQLLRDSQSCVHVGRLHIDWSVRSDETQESDKRQGE
ncbi:uncharacterized protein LOC124252893 [Haliotis rubra]|uniref:uncharacterized protein LOC124252893 n=1 Tax=Haliotis rubra TaxID=36100 RepID=UPI001EE53105|nr:uncharacterized protein LOC124252893 [Haliotis rubra]